MSCHLDVKTMYAKFGPSIYVHCRRILKNEASAEDATQEVFLKVMRHLRSAPDDKAVLCWIRRIATNHCLNVLRDERRRTCVEVRQEHHIDHHFEEELVGREVAKRVLASTSDELRMPAMMYHGLGVAQGKVAAALGVSRRTVLYRLAEFTRQAMRKMAEA